MNAHSYATVIPDERSASGAALRVCARTGDQIARDRLVTMAPHYELARREAQLRYPDRLIVVPMLGEKVPT